MKDGRGIDLKVGDDVMVQMASPSVVGRIVQVSDGGIISGLKRGGLDERPGTVTVIAQFTISADGRNPVLGSVLKLAGTPVKDLPEDAGPQIVEALPQ